MVERFNYVHGIAAVVLVAITAAAIWSITRLVAEWSSMGWFTRASWVLLPMIMFVSAAMTMRRWNRAMHDDRRTWERDDWKGG